MGDAAERDQRAQVWERGNARDQELPAGGDLGGGRLVLRRHATHGVRDHAIDEFERLRGSDVVMPTRKPDPEQRAVKQLAGIIAEEGTAGTVGAFQSWRESDDEEPRIIVA